MVRTATCTCGQLRALCEGEPQRVSICHCLACKRRTGSAFSLNATYARDQVETKGSFTTFTRRSDGGRWATYSFCPRCGSSVFYEVEARPGRISIPVGGFADKTFPEPTVEVYTNRRMPWTTFATKVPLADD